MSENSENHKSACAIPSQADLANIGNIKKTEAQWRQILTPIQYYVAREQGTERPFNNAYWNNKKDGIYVSVGTNIPLFSSKDKYESGTGWPSFTQPLWGAPVSTQVDQSHGMTRVEVHCAADGSHLGHVFSDGPKPTGKRYCINSASLTFIPVEELNKEYKKLYFPEKL